MNVHLEGCRYVATSSDDSVESQRNDRRIARVIAVRLLDVLSPNCGPITVRVRDGVVLISGVVESVAMARAAVAVAWAIPGVRDVHAQMTWPTVRRRWWNWMSS